MTRFLWPADDGWPYPDTELEVVDPEAEADDDLLSVRAAGTHVLDDLDPLERTVVAARFGLQGTPVRTMKQLRSELGVPRADLRLALGSGLDKLRHRLAP